MRRFVIGLSGAAAFVAIVAATATVGAAPEPQVIKMSVKKFAFSMTEVKVKKGTPVVFELTTLDRAHGFSLPDFDVRGDVNPGGVTRISINPDKAGEFDYFCDIFCGDGHEEVTGKLIVTE